MSMSREAPLGQGILANENVSFAVVDAKVVQVGQFYAVVCFLVDTSLLSSVPM